MLTWRSRKLLAKKSVRDEELPVLGSPGCLGLVKILGICSGLSCHLIYELGIAPGRHRVSVCILLSTKQGTSNKIPSVIAGTRSSLTLEGLQNSGGTETGVCGYGTEYIMKSQVGSCLQSLKPGQGN